MRKRLGAKKLVISGLALAAIVCGLLSACAHKAPPAVTVRVTMRKFAIDPSVIYLKVGQPVRFEVYSADVEHGFYVPDLGIREPMRPGKPAVFDFTPGRKGTFEMKCGILCGPGHDRMKGTIVVQ